MLFPLSVFATDTCPAGYQPAEYIELEYIESTGTQYIDTGIYTSDVDEIYLRIQCTRYNQGYFIGDGNSVMNRYNYIGIHNAFSSSFGENWGSETNWTKFNVPFDTNVHEIKVAINPVPTFFFDGSLVATQSTYATPSQTLKLIINNNVAGSNNRPYAMYYSVKLSRNNQLIRDFIPVRRLPDGEIGMLDRVSGKFYGNDGTGEFIAGPEIEASQSFITDENGDVVCVSCPANTYKPNAGNTECTKCPEHTFSPVGSKELGDCAKILRVKDYVVYMPLGKRTEHGLCVMSDGKKYCADVYERQ